VTTLSWFRTTEYVVRVDAFAIASTNTSLSPSATPSRCWVLVARGLRNHDTESAAVTSSLRNTPWPMDVGRSGAVWT
jgi:hypothetical protein